MNPPSEVIYAVTVIEEWIKANHLAYWSFRGLCTTDCISNDTSPPISKPVTIELSRQEVELFVDPRSVVYVGRANLPPQYEGIYESLRIQHEEAAALDLTYLNLRITLSTYQWQQIIAHIRRDRSWFSQMESCFSYPLRPLQKITAALGEPLNLFTDTAT